MWVTIDSVAKGELNKTVTSVNYKFFINMTFILDMATYFSLLFENCISLLYSDHGKALRRLYL